MNWLNKEIGHLRCSVCGHRGIPIAGKCPYCNTPVKKRHWWFWSILFTLILMVYFGSKYDVGTDSSRVKVYEPTHNEGDTVDIGYTTYTVWRSWWSSKLSENQYRDEKPNAMFLFVELSVRNEDKKPRTIPSFQLLDGNGAEYESSSKSWRVENSIGSLDSLNPDVQKRGVVVFDVPDYRDYRLKVSGGFWSSKYALIRLVPEKTQEVQLTKTKPREIVYNSRWDSSVSQVEKYLKQNLKDPKSYESIEWSPVVKLDADDLQHKFIVRHKYRAKNSFGGYVISNQMFYLDKHGYVLRSTEYGQ